jgi:hypothetical protein
MNPETSFTTILNASISGEDIDEFRTHILVGDLQQVLRKI